MKNTSPSRIWHPMTQHGLQGAEISVERAQGAYLYTKSGKQIIDGISSWWVNTHGHCHPRIVRAVQEQADKLEQVIFAGFTHDRAEELSQKLLQLTGPYLEYIFYSDSGSTAIEAAIKMAIGYFEHNGAPRRKIIALEGGYHGDTFGAMSASSRSVFNKLYEPFLFEVTHLPFPEKNREHVTLEALENILQQEGDNIAAFIFEPLILGAAGMKIYSPEILKDLYDLCRQHNVLLIADEVMTGFGRTGTLFACEQAEITPDLLCLSKGITGGFLPMGATLCSRDIYMAFYHEDRAKTFFHSTSFTGNALSCAAALASLEIWEEEPVMERIQAINKSHTQIISRFEAREEVKEVRALGSIFALDIRDDVDGYLSEIGPQIYELMLDRDVLLRPIGNTVYILPPYCVSKDDLRKIYDALWQSLDKIQDEHKHAA